ncbi:3586_t:CDS:2, partial [Diversispora eburnea]
NPVDLIRDLATRRKNSLFCFKSFFEEDLQLDSLVLLKKYCLSNLCKA